MLGIQKTIRRSASRVPTQDRRCSCVYDIGPAPPDLGSHATFFFYPDGQECQFRYHRDGKEIISLVVSRAFVRGEVSKAGGCICRGV